MELIARGRGTPLVFIPGLQGRWEYTQLTLDALAKHFRVVTFSLDRPKSARAEAFDDYAANVEAAVDAAGCDRAAVCGLSFGGLVALRFAATRPERCASLVLASTPGPGWRPRPRHDFYARWPFVFGPVFLAEAPFRAGPEIAAALPSRRERRAFGRAMLRTMLSAPPSLPGMAARARLIASYDRRADCARVAVPTLVVTGEPALDRVVTVDGTAEYARLIRGAAIRVLERTGHQGSLTRPDAFAEIVRAFVEKAHDAAA